MKVKWSSVTPGKSPRCPLHTSLCGLQSRSRRAGVQKYIVPLLGIKCRSVRLTRGLITILNEVPRLLFGVRALFFVTHHRNKDVPGNVKKTRRAVEGEHNHSYPRRYMGMNGQHHVSTALNLGKEPHACRLRLKCDGTLAETRFRLSTKRTSPFKSAGASVQSTTGSRGVRISCSNSGYTMFRGSV